MFKSIIFFLIWFCSHIQKKGKKSYTGVYCYWFPYFFVRFTQSVRLNIIVFMYLSILFVTLFNYFSITSNLIFCLLNTNKESKQHTHVLSRKFSQQVPGLSNRCTFALANGLSRRFISRYWVSLLGLALCPSRELVLHLSTQVNIGYLAV